MTEDPRTRVTKQLLKDAIKKEAAKKSFDKITVKSICDRAHVSRPTFYAYYQDIFDLYLDYEKDIIEDLGLSRSMKNLFTKDGSEQIILRILEHVDENKELYTAFFDRYNPYFSQYVLGPVIQDVAHAMVEAGRFSSMDEADLFIQYHTAGLMVSISRWFKEDPKKRMDREAFALAISGYTRSSL